MAGVLVALWAVEVAVSRSRSVTCPVLINGNGNGLTILRFEILRTHNVGPRLVLVLESSLLPNLNKRLVYGTLDGPDSLVGAADC